MNRSSLSEATEEKTAPAPLQGAGKKRDSDYPRAALRFTLGCIPVALQATENLLLPNRKSIMVTAISNREGTENRGFAELRLPKTGTAGKMPAALGAQNPIRR